MIDNIKKSIKNYRSICQKNDEENYFFDKYIFRKISIFFTILFIKMKIGSNTTTFVSLIFCLLACFFLMHNTTSMLILSLSCILLYYTLDHVDGELARYYIKTGINKPSIKGQYFDQLVHLFSANLFLFFIGLSVYWKFNLSIFIILGFISCIGLSSFPNLMASKLVLQNIVKKPGFAAEPSYLKIFDKIEQKREAINIVKNGRGFKKYQKIAGEMLIFPGSVILCAVTILFDILITDISILGICFNFRMALLLTLTPVYVTKLIKDWISWMIRFNDVA